MTGAARPHWGFQTSLFQPRRWAFWFFAAMLALGGLVFIAEQLAFVEAAAGGWLLSWILLAFYAVPVVVVVMRFDLFEREPISLMVGALLWGAVVAASLSGLANEGWGYVVIRIGGPEFASAWGAALIAPFTEEILKTLGVVVLYLIASSEFDDVMDGFVYGALVGLGFKLAEDVFYFVAEFGGTVEGVVGGFIIRVVLSGLYTHTLYSALAGCAVALFVDQRDRRSRTRRFAIAGALMASAVAAHFLWNSPLLEPASGSESLLLFAASAVFKGIPFLLLLAVMLTLAARRERRWLAAAFTGEEGGPGLEAGELSILRSSRRRRREYRNLRRRSGRGAARLLRRLRREQINLAMVRCRIEAADHPDARRQRDVCASLRRELRAAASNAPG